MPNIWNAIYLGNSAAVLDPTEGSDIKENAGAIVGNTYGSIGDPLADHIVEVTAITNGGLSHALDDNNSVSNDQVSYDLGGGVQTETYDAHVEYSATITYFDGTTATVTAVIFQDASGNLFLAPETSFNADATAYEAQAIRSITLNSVTIDNWDGLWVNRHDTAFICFAAGTLIDTPDGGRAAEDLRPGDLVTTADHGPQPIRWTRSDQQPLEDTKVDAKPVLIKAGALGRTLPAQDQIVSPQHRILVGGAGQLQHIFPSEAFALAKSLTAVPGIRHMKGKTQIIWIHFACDRHEVVFANGCLSESLLLGPMVVKGMATVERRALADIFGVAPAPGAALNGPPARECLTVGAVRRLLAGHLKARRDFAADRLRADKALALIGEGTRHVA